MFFYSIILYLKQKYYNYSNILMYKQVHNFYYIIYTFLCCYISVLINVVKLKYNNIKNYKLNKLNKSNIFFI